MLCYDCGAKRGFVAYERPMGTVYLCRACATERTMLDELEADAYEANNPGVVRVGFENWVVPQ